MKLLELEFSGFKSFRKKTVFRFEDGICAIIGANGAGKSNVSDAIRWVLGEQSLKNLRGKGSEDVIFAGSDGKRSGQARASLTLSNESGRLSVDAAEVKLSRSVTRAGEGEYRINEDPVRLWDVQQMLAEAGLGTKSYAVISQGAVDQYLNAGPAARRELFDEACGIKGLQLKLGRAERAFTQTEAKIHELKAVLHEMEPRLRVLKRQAVRFQERGKIQQAYDEAQKKYFAVGWIARAAAVSRMREESAGASELLERARKAREEIESGLFRELDRKQPEITEPGQKAAGKMPAAREVEAALRHCLKILEVMLAGEHPDRSELRELKREAGDLLKRIEQSRKPRGASGGEPEKESEETRELRLKLENARNAELRAERENSAVGTALQHAAEELEEWEREIQREAGSHFLSELPSVQMPADEDEAELEIKVKRLEAKLAALGEIDPLIVREFEQTDARWRQMSDQLRDVLQAQRDTDRQIALLRREIQERFKDRFKAISRNFKENFALLFGGGSAKLELIEESGEGESGDDQSAAVKGIDIAVSPPGKKPRHIGLLSGGEKALTSLALLLAVIQVQKPPFLVLDEVDAALDEANSYRFAETLEKMAEFTQCIVITHNRETMGRANVLYGVAMGTEGESEIYSVKMEDVTSNP